MRWVLLAGLAALVAGVLLFPLRLAVSRLAPGLEADTVAGSIWNGQMRNARWDGVPLGDLDVGLDYRSLLAGDASLGFTRLNPELTGVLGGNRQVKRIAGLNGDVRLAVLPAPLPEIALSFSDVSASFHVDRGCRAAGGTVTAKVSGIPLIGDTPPLQGTPRCDGEALLIRLVAPSGPLALDLWLWQDARYRAGVVVLTANPLTRRALSGAGFTPSNEGATLLVEGRPGVRPARVQG